MFHESSSETCNVAILAHRLHISEHLIYIPTIEIMNYYSPALSPITISISVVIPPLVLLWWFAFVPMEVGQISPIVLFPYEVSPQSPWAGVDLPVPVEGLPRKVYKKS